MSYQLIIKNFELDEAFKKIFGSKLNELLDLSPSDAGLISKITKTKAGYLGMLEVLSSQGRFVAEAVENDLEKMVKSLFQVMHKKLGSWRNLRFLHE